MSYTPIFAIVAYANYRVYTINVSSPIGKARYMLFKVIKEPEVLKEPEVPR